MHSSRFAGRFGMGGFEVSDETSELLRRYGLDGSKVT